MSSTIKGCQLKVTKSHIEHPDDEGGFSYINLLFNRPYFLVDLIPSLKHTNHSKNLLAHTLTNVATLIVTLLKPDRCNRPLSRYNATFLNTGLKFNWQLNGNTTEYSREGSLEKPRPTRLLYSTRY